MNLIDACVIPYPEGDSSLHRLACDAGSLGMTGIVAIGVSEPVKMGRVSVIPGRWIPPGRASTTIAEIRKAARLPGLVISDAGDAAFNRALISAGGLHILKGLCRLRRGSLDHFTARTAAQNGVAIDIGIDAILQERGPSRQRVLQSCGDILRLQRRFLFPLTISSGALSTLDLRAPREITGLCGLFGMKPAEVEAALSVPADLQNPDRIVEVIG